MPSPAASAETDPTKLAVDPQDPLPESNWIYRRLLIFIDTFWQVLLLAAVVTGIGFLGLSNPLSAINALTYIAYCLIALLALERTLYLIAPSAETFGKWVQQVSAWKGGIFTRARSTAETADGKVTTETSTGRPPATPAPEPETPRADQDPPPRNANPDPAPPRGPGFQPRSVGAE